MAKKYSSVLTIFLCAIFLTCVFGHRGVSMASQNTEQKNNLMVQMEYYQYNVCASCHPEDDFFAVVSDTISPIKQKYPYEIAVYNTFRAEDKKRFEKRLQELMLKEADVSLPTLIMISEDSEALMRLKKSLKIHLSRLQSQGNLFLVKRHLNRMKKQRLHL